MHGEWPKYSRLAVNDLFVDITYQRPETRLIKQIANELRAEQFGTIIVSARDDGRYAIVDGQQRVGAARLIGITHVPCLVLTGKTLAEEARLFVRLQKDRLNVRAYQRFQAEKVAEDPRALELQSCIDRAGLALIESSGEKEHPDSLAAVGHLEKTYDLGGAGIVDTTFEAIKAAWPGMTGRFRGEIVLAVGTVIAQDDADIARLVEVLADDRPRKLGTPNRLMERSVAMRKGVGLGGGSTKYTIAVIREDYRAYGRGSRRRAKD